MHEIIFINQNQDKWKRFEQLMANPKQANADELADLFIEMTDDLAYAKTFYPKSKTAQYLNQLTVDIHKSIYQNKKEDKKRFITFFTEEVPMAVYKSWKYIGLSLLIFIMAMAIGFLSSVNDEDFTRLILGDTYVNMTIENIEKGDPFAVYKSDSQTMMFYMIGSNNIRVAFIAFIGGITFAQLTAFAMLFNGIMVGAFGAFFL